jgi:exonuclease-1
VRTMGISGLLPVLKSIQRPVNASEYEGKRVAIDGYCWLHRGVFSCSRELCEGEDNRRYVLAFDCVSTG